MKLGVVVKKKEAGLGARGVWRCWSLDKRDVALE
jgi:hypothetical protein